jgi:hypothetical protein
MSEATRRAAIRVSDDKKGVAIEFLPHSGVAGTLNLDVNGLSHLIATLGTARQVMVAGNAIPPLEGQKIQVVFNAQWYVQPEPLSEGSVLGFYHPGFGPVGFVVPRHQVAEMVRLLTAHLGISRSTAGKPN